MQLTIRFHIISILLISVSLAYSQTETYETYLKTDEIAENAVLKLQDPRIYTSSGFNTGWSNDFRIRETNSGVELFIDPYTDDYGNNNFSMDVDLKVTYRDDQDKVVQNSEGKDTTLLTLSVDYTAQGKHRNRDIQVLENAHLMHVEVESVNIQGADTASLTNTVILRSFISVERYTDMKNTRVDQPNHQYHAENNELHITWQEKSGAKWYDLEWAFVDNYGIQNGAMQPKSANKLRIDFSENSQRIRTKATEYSIPIVYEQGYLVYRVRPIAPAGPNFDLKQYGPWTIKENIRVSDAGNQVFEITPSMVHENDKMNWAYDADFSERMHNQAKVIYYDGLYYDRQRVNQLKSENDVLISEKFYDHHGREALETLPATSGNDNPSPSLAYYDAFNLNNQGVPYQKNDFDDITDCTPSAESMSNQSGAAKYYSSANSSNHLFKDYLPDAEGYPFKQTQFHPDRTGDVRKKGKAGPQYQIGSGHEIQKFKGTPGQSELDRLFGSEAGFARHYQKRIISDENGQLRVQYINEDGNPIATALAGDSPPALQSLPPEQKETLNITEDVLSNSQTIRNNSIETTQHILVATEGTQYSFNYTVEPATFSRSVCDAEQICYDGLYNLSIQLISECGDVIEEKTQQIGDLTQIDETCNDNQPVTVSFSSGPLSVGTYTLTKKLELNEKALEEYLSLFSEKSCIQEHWQTLFDSNMERYDTTDCNIDCGNASAIQSEYNYTTEDGEERTTSLSDEEVAQLEQQRKNLCGSGENLCQSGYEAMLRDVSPGGQYALYYDTINNENSTDKFPLSVLNATPTNKMPLEDAHWRNPANIYRDATGNIAYIPLSEINGTDGVYDENKIYTQNGDDVIRPENLLYFSDFIDFWEDSWAEALVPYHPEYGYYLYCKQFPESNNFDSHLLGGSSFNHAADSGWVSQNGATNLFNLDPYFQEHPQLAQDMQNRMEDYVTIEGESFSLKDIVIAMHNGCAVMHCSSGGVDLAELKQCIQNNNPLFAGKPAETQEQEWSSYRSLYLALKREIMHEERHTYAVSEGYYNGCIGIEKNDDEGIGTEVLEFLGNYAADSDVDISRSCFECTSCYTDKTIRFPDGNDLYKFIDGVNATNNVVAQADQLENYADNRLKEDCDKCPPESDMETFLNGVALNQGITNKQDATNAIASCELKDQMNAADTDFFTWEASVSGRELNGKIKAGDTEFCTISLYDSTTQQIPWDSIRMFTCLEHITEANHYETTNTRNFKVRAITKDNNVYWLEGISSCIDLTDCDIEKFCEKNEIASDLKSLFNKTFGIYPEIRKMLVENGNDALADQQMPLYQNTGIIGEMQIELSDRLKEEHVSPARPTKYNWLVTYLSKDRKSISIDIAGPKKIERCTFNFEILDSENSFEESFIIKDIHLNHPAADQNTCEATDFVIEALPISLGNNNTENTDGINSLADAVSLGDPFFIKATNRCFPLGECCEANDCPELTANGDFSQNRKNFKSDLPYSESEDIEEFHAIYPREEKKPDSSGFDFTGDINPGLIDSGDLIINQDLIFGFDADSAVQEEDEEGQNTFNFIDTPGIQSGENLTGEGFQQIPRNIQNISQSFGMVEQLIKSGQDIENNMGNNMSDENLPFFSQGQAQIIETLAMATPDSEEDNHYLVFKVTQNAKRDIWKQKYTLEPGKAYAFSVNVRPFLRDTELNPQEVSGRFTLSVNGLPHELEYAENRNQWYKLKTTFTTNETEGQTITITYQPSSEISKDNGEKWAVDNISLKAESCPKPGCCPPVFPALPEDAVNNPCEERKKSLADFNTNIEYDQFLQDTLSSIESAYRKAILNPQETFTMSYSDHYYDYTLYYYDQSGNLTKTVPPNGIKPMGSARVDAVQDHRNEGLGNPDYPDHKEASTYQYNSYDKIIKSYTPDEGETRYWYDKLGRVIATQSAVQNKKGNVYSYFFYDEFNRKTETGEVKAISRLTRPLTMNYNAFRKWVSQGQRTEVIHQYYDEPLNNIVNNLFPAGQENLRKRTATVIYEEDWDENENTYDFATHYSYDPHGNVNYVVKENNEFPDEHRIKKIAYRFDVINKSISEIIYQPDEKDQFMHQYHYDEDNRLHKVLTSRHGIIWDEEARYYYYPHGKLARIELGNNKVQGIDYAYTLQGWLKGINSAGLDVTQDAGKDGNASGIFANVSSDAVSMILDYHNDDYKAAGGNNTFTEHLNSPLGSASPNQYTANPRMMTLNNAGLPEPAGLAFAYEYDQFERLVNTTTYKKQNQSWQNTSQYQTEFTYDANGNPVEIKRHGDNGLMDDLTFNYQQNNNRVDNISDNVNAGSYPDDLDDQSQGNYHYDLSGRLIKDQSENLETIEWSKDNKVKSVSKTDYGLILNHYDGTGFRVMKDLQTENMADSEKISYVRGLNNEILASYRHRKDTDSVYLDQYNIYGESRLGSINMDTALENVNPGRISQYGGIKHFEIRNHTDNVLATVSDKKLADTTGSQAKFIPDVTMAAHYYPYGSMLPGQAKSTENYDFGYQGQEKDDELKGTGNAYYFEERMYDPRAARWLSVDPKAQKYPGQSPYNAMAGNPIKYIDPDGMEPRVNEETSNSSSAIRNNFRFNEDCRDCGIDRISQSESETTTVRNDQGGFVYSMNTVVTTSVIIGEEGNIEEINRNTLTTVQTGAGHSDVTQFTDNEQISLNETNTNFQDAVNNVAQIKRETGKSPTQLAAIENENTSDIAETIGSIATVGGFAISFIPSPYTSAGGRVVGGIGVISLGVSSTNETNPEKITIEH
ncbi:MAG: RHS repeat domain-containing protein [Bacteroidota bacterium]